MTTKRKARLVLRNLRLGLTAKAALAAAAADEDTTVRQVVVALRTMRLLFLEERDARRHETDRKRSPAHVRRMLDAAERPADVIVVRWGHTAEEEAWRLTLLDALGVSISALPSVVVWQDARTFSDEDGEHVIPAGWRAVAIRHRYEWSWLTDAAPTDRVSDAALWARRKAAPPAPVDA